MCTSGAAHSQQLEKQSSISRRGRHQRVVVDSFSLIQSHHLCPLHLQTVWQVGNGRGTQRAHTMKKITQPTMTIARAPTLQNRPTNTHLLPQTLTYWANARAVAAAVEEFFVDPARLQPRRCIRQHSNACQISNLGRCGPCCCSGGGLLCGRRSRCCGRSWSRLHRRDSAGSWEDDR